MEENNRERMAAMQKAALMEAMKRAQPEIYVTSIKEAESLIRGHLTPGDGHYRRKLVEYIIDPANEVTCDCDVCHNFIVRLFDIDDYVLALKVCDFALEKAPYNRDMLANALRACGDSCQFERGEQYFARAMELPYAQWSYRMFLYGGFFFKAKLKAYPMDQELYQRGLALADEYISAFPFDERSYNLKAELMLIMNDRERAIAELEYCIFEVQPDKQDKRSELTTAQCCLTLLNELEDTNRYDMIIDICDKGIQNTTRGQPTARVGFFVYRKALALEGKAHAEKCKIPDTVRSALQLYQIAYDLNQNNPYAATIEQRYALLKSFADDVPPLVKRPLYTE